MILDDISFDSEVQGLQRSLARCKKEIHAAMVAAVALIVFTILSGAVSIWRDTWNIRGYAGVTGFMVLAYVGCLIYSTKDFVPGIRLFAILIVLFHIIMMMVFENMFAGLVFKIITIIFIYRGIRAQDEMENTEFLLERHMVAKGKRDRKASTESRFDI